MHKEAETLLFFGDILNEKGVVNVKDYSFENNLNEERALWERGYKYIAGVDEVGRGPWAGNVTACAVIMPIECRLDRLTDSKLIKSKRQKEDFYNQIDESCISYAIGVATVEEIDHMRLTAATRLAMKRAVEGLIITPDFLLIDGNEIVETKIPQKSLQKGDYLSHSISAASLMAKVTRDKEMTRLDETLYGGRHSWLTNAGYINSHHVSVVAEYGLTPHHRRHFKTSLPFLTDEELERYGHTS